MSPAKPRKTRPGGRRKGSASRPKKTRGGAQTRTFSSRASPTKRASGAPASDPPYGKRAVAARELLPSAPQGGRLFVLDVPFELRAVVQAAGAKWNAVLKAHVYVSRDDDSLPAGLKPFRSRPYSWERWREDDINGEPDVSDLLDPEGIVYERKEHQKEAIQAASACVGAGRVGFLLGDEVGVGKTISAVGAAEAALRRREPCAKKVLVVTPKSSVPHWRTTLQRMPEAVRGMRVAVTNWEGLKRLLVPPTSAAKAKKTRTKNKRIAAEGKPVEDFDVVIADESHRLRSPSSQTTMAFETISKGAFVVWASATAGQTPLELYYLAALLAQVTGRRVEDPADFETWCRAQGIGVRRGAYGRLEWVGSEEEKRRDRETMRRLLYEAGPHGPAAGIRRVPEDIAGWPAIQRIAYPTSLDAAARILYEEAWTVFRKEMELSARGRDPKNGRVAKLRFRQKCSLLRAPATADLVLQMLENGRQVAVSCEFLESLSAIEEELAASGIECSVIHGGVVGDEREAERLAFQRGERRACLFTVTEAISLHRGEEPGGEAPRVTLVHDPRYSAIPAAQIEGRAHRSGNAANVYYLYGEETVEEGVVITAIRRVRDMKEMGGDDVGTLDEMEAALCGGTV